jgi:hypothetical protein
MWTETFVLAERIKGPLLIWTGGLIVTVTALDRLAAGSIALLPESILGFVAQTMIVVAALRVGLDADAQAAIRPLFARAFGISLVSNFAIALGGLLLVVPGVFLLLRWWVAVPVALDRDIGVSEALRESWQITGPHWASILGLLIGLLAILAIPMIGFFFVGAFEDEAASLPLDFASNLVTYTVTNLGTVSTVAAYRMIYQPAAQLRQVFE